MKLNYLDITSKLTKDTPKIVVLDIANAHGISIRESMLDDQKYF